MLNDGEENARGGSHVTASQSVARQPKTVLFFSLVNLSGFNSLLYIVPPTSSPLWTLAYADAGDNNPECCLCLPVQSTTRRSRIHGSDRGQALGVSLAQAVGGQSQSQGGLGRYS